MQGTWRKAENSKHTGKTVSVSEELSLELEALITTKDCSWTSVTDLKQIHMLQIRLFSADLHLVRI